MQVVKKISRVLALDNKQNSEKDNKQNSENSNFNRTSRSCIPASKNIYDD